MPKNRIRELLARRDLTAGALSALLGEPFTPTLMSYIINGKALPTPSSLTRLCTALDCTPCDLYDRADVDLLSAFDSANSEPITPQSLALTASETQALNTLLAAVERCVGERRSGFNQPEVIISESEAY